ncbi:poly polymerase 2 ADP-ribosyltransferase 2 [Cordyceps fumosorosea ARSEF 2679]|uniref:Poly [ADP-ribose] polymerase n=1 Tax=Cordyceps fumosorosea (strain ARSEF 2679) TaxID=1081104 RepID=A0A162LLH0_CORFA|nr:poly polymerase 2 ADP-ribosyltransferase 2 [Cordyceps fumosorosea ARSEF 2679]OAA72364.1 poly polymerase 2 ADP-ribosyltransferase 2 [Cordyceps fumosorosea ARSEF 2679]
MAPRRKAAQAPTPTNGAATNGTTAATTTFISTSVIPDATPYGAVHRPLEGLRVVVSGHVNVSDHVPYSVEYLLGDLGAVQENRVLNAVTHVISSREDYLKNATKVRNGTDKGLPIVRGAWVVECDRTQTLVDVDKHTWPNVIEQEKKLQDARQEFLAAEAAGKTNGTVKKRPIAVANPDDTAANGDDEPDEEQVAEPKTKKPRAARGKKQAAIQDEDEEMKDAEDDSAKQLQEEDTKGAGTEQAQIAKQGLVIPVDNFCPLPGVQVYIDPDSGVIYDASLNQTNASNNNNKFYIIQLLHDPKANKFSTWTRWGRVGEPGANASLGNGTFDNALTHFDKKFKDKSGLRWTDRSNPPRPGKYAFVERSYEPDSDNEDDDAAGDGEEAKAVKEEEPEPDCTLDDSTKALMEMIFNNSFMQATLAELNYDANKLPLGKLSKATILRGFEQLKSLSDLFDDNALAASRWNMTVPAATEHLSNTYYSLIPHDFGRQRPPIISDERRLKREVELLESLSDMKIAADLMKADRKNTGSDPVHHLDRKFQGLNMEEMTPLKRTSKEFKTLEQYLCGTVGTTHALSYQVVDIFRIERRGERERFGASAFAGVPSDRRLLWHGSRSTNFGGILSQGLRIAPPEAPVSGYMFGKGIYLADMSSKSANYCCPSMSRGEGLLLLCDAELGDPMHELVHSSYTADDEARAAGSWSTKGQGTWAPPQWMDASAVHKSLKGIKMPDPSKPAEDTKIPNASLYYNEYICYDVDQVQLRYLFRVKM